MNFGFFIFIHLYILLVDARVSDFPEVSIGKLLDQGIRSLSHVFFLQNSQLYHLAHIKLVDVWSLVPLIKLFYFFI